MKVLFRNTTKYTKEKYNDFLKFHDNKYGTKELIRLILIGLCLLYIFIFNIVCKKWYIILLFIVLAVIIYFFNKLSSDKRGKKNKRKIEKEYTFYFYENHIKIKYKRQFERLKYFSLHKIFETDKYFFLYLDERNSLILSKDGFEIGTAEGFSKFIKGKCPLKYSKEKK